MRLSCKVSVVAAAGVDCRFEKVGLGVGGGAVNIWLEVVFDLAMISVPDRKLVSVFIFIAYLAVDFRWVPSIN
jgi:hypothetical protein